MLVRWLGQHTPTASSPTPCLDARQLARVVVMVRAG